MNIKNDKENSKFATEVEGHEAVLDYKRGPENAYNLLHTGVPSQAQGKGIANLLVEAAVEAAKSENVKIIASCSYVKNWFEKHPEEKSLLQK